VHNFVSSGQGYWASNSFAISCADDDSDLVAHNNDRQYLCKHLAGALYERVSSLLSDPVVQAASALNHNWWLDVDFAKANPDYSQLDSGRR
jgi:hypothetical protein